ncbi:MAG: hypothetical protein M5U19_21640 [Microthrixaceae bacterium]|nr:hypothetical protein [Microthrixaceae bacterium]
MRRCTRRRGIPCGGSARAVPPADHRQAHADRYRVVGSVPGNDEAAEAARAELATGDLDAWEQGVGAIEEHRAEALAAYESAFEAYRAEAAAITEAENSADVAELSLQVEALRSELREAMDDWTVATLAHGAIDHTLRRFETERQPEVVRSAAECFRRITDGRYTNLVPEDDSLLVVDSDRNRLDSSKLSRGATEQLYLAMRLALARQYARSSALPLVLDDVLVNADPRRRVRLAAELQETAADMQVLVFTCHPRPQSSSATPRHVAECAPVPTSSR